MLRPEDEPCSDSRACTVNFDLEGWILRDYGQRSYRRPSGAIRSSRILFVPIQAREEGQGRSRIWDSVQNSSFARILTYPRRMALLALAPFGGESPVRIKQHVGLINARHALQLNHVPAQTTVAVSFFMAPRPLAVKSCATDEKL